jgi:hypothetical protein
VDRLGYQARVSAVSGIQSTLQILFVVVASVPLRIIIERIFSRDVSVDWRTSLIAGCSIAALWYLGVCISTFVDMRRDAVSGRKPRQSFPATAFATGVYGLDLLLSAAMMIGSHQEGDPMWVQLTPLVFVWIAFMGWPRTIHVDETGVWQRTRWGRKRRIRFEDVLAVSHEHGTTTVTGTVATIEHTPYHVGARRIEEVLEKRTHKRIYYGGQPLA